MTDNSHVPQPSFVMPSKLPDLTQADYDRFAFKEARLERHMTQEQFGAALGITASLVTKIERGERNVSDQVMHDLRKLAKPASDTGTRVEAGEVDREAQARVLLRAAVSKRDATGASLVKHDDECEVDVGAAVDAIMSALAASPATATGGVRDHAGSVREADDEARRNRIALQDIAEAEPIPSPAEAFVWCREVALAALHPVDSRAQGDAYNAQAGGEEGE